MQITLEDIETKSLNQIMEMLGYRHERDEYSPVNGAHKIYRGDEFIGRMHAFAAWEYLRDKHNLPKIA